jgi:hypothetical protein
MKFFIPMKYIFFTFLMSNVSFAENSLPEAAEIEVGAPKDCVVLEKTEDQKKLGPQHELQQLITDCLSPEERESKFEAMPSEVVSQ